VPGDGSGRDAELVGVGDETGASILGPLSQERDMGRSASSPRRIAAALWSCLALRAGVRPQSAGVSARFDPVGGGGRKDMFLRLARMSLLRDVASRDKRLQGVG
jgi:hypothetical protein